jgi:hypothetical protein
MAAPTKYVMPPYGYKPGRPPNPVRWLCDAGHVHPSRRAAVKCNQKNRRPPS